MATAATTRGRKPQLFTVYQWMGNRAGWQLSCYRLASSRRGLLKLFPRYADKRRFMVLSPAQGRNKHSEEQEAGAQADKQARFQPGETVKISTQTGWTPGEVREVLHWPQGVVVYVVWYIPTWDETRQGGLTIVTGAAVRKPEQEGTI